MNRRGLVLNRAALCLIAAATSCAFAQSIPFITAVTPGSVVPGAGDTPITIAGSNFNALSVVSINGTQVTSIAPAISNNQNGSTSGETLKFTLPASYLTTAGIVTIQVVNYANTNLSAVRTLTTFASTPSVTSNPAYLYVTNSNSSLSYGLSSVGSPISNATVQTFVTGDFNNDGVLDVAAANGDGTVSIFLGDGKGGYGAGVTLGTPSAAPTSIPNALAVGDFNNDGNLDLAVSLLNSSDFSGTVQIYLGNGNGTLSASLAAPVTLAAPVLVSALAVGDVNGDGKLDLYAISPFSSASYILLGDGTGTLGAQQIGGTSDFPVSPNATALVAGDFNGDGLTDFAYVDSTINELVVLLATPPAIGSTSTSITFTETDNTSLGDTAPTGIVTGDFNGDGITDLVIAFNNDGSYLFLPGNGNGTFGAQSIITALKTAATAKATAKSAASSATPPFPSAGGTTTSITAADFNGDGFVDIALYNGTSLNVYLGDGTGNFNYTAELVTNDTSGNAGLAAGNLNNSGYPGFIAGLNSSFVAILPPVPTSPFAVPASLSLGSVNLGANATQNLVLTNNTATAVTLQTLTITGANATDFSIPATNPCASVAAAGTCQIPVTFTPTVVGSETATLTIADSVGSQTVSLTGTGVGVPTASAPASANLGSANVGGTPVTGNVVLTNTGTGALMVTTVTTAAPFSITSDGCSGKSVAAAASCSVTVAFTPTALGAASGILTFNDNSSTGASQTTNLAGTGLGAVASVSTTPLAFGNQNVGSTSAPQTVTVKNTGTANLTVTSVTTAAPFAVSNNGCTSAVTPGSSCTISVTFTPTAAGAAPATNLTIVDNSVPTGTQTVALTGTGVATSGPKATVTPASLTFASQLVGTTSTSQIVTLKNSGTSALTITSITATAPFAISAKTCGTALAVNATCAVAVDFHPAAAGPATGTLTFTDNSVLAKTQVLNLSGTGTAPTASVTPTSLAFGGIAVNLTSAAQPVIISNTGSATLSIGGITASGNFAVSANTCKATLAAAASCTVSVTFTPRATGALTGTLTITDNSSTGTTQKVALSGTGINLKLSANPGSLIFTGLPNVKSAAQTVTVTNTGTVAISGLNVALAGTGAADYAVASNTCGATLSVGASCKVGITYLSKTIGEFSAQLNVSSNAPTVSVSLLGLTF